MHGHLILDIGDMCSIGFLTTHLIDWTEVEHVATLILLYWRYFENIFWWIPIVFIWNSNVLTCLNIVICGIPSNKSTCGSHHLYWDMGVKMFLNHQFNILIGRVIAYWYTKNWHGLEFIRVFSILFPNHKPWPNIGIMTSTDSILYEVAPALIGIFTYSE